MDNETAQQLEPSSQPGEPPARRLRIELSAHGKGQVYLDGQRIKGVQRVEFAAAAGGLNLCTLSVMVDTVAIEAPAAVDLVPRQIPNEGAGDMEQNARVYPLRVDLARAPDSVAVLEFGRGPNGELIATAQLGPEAYALAKANARTMLGGDGGT